MANLDISQTHDYFVYNGKSFFYLADTVWTAFSNITLDEWEEYLEYRRMQNFNAIQMNILTQWDGGKPDTGLYPFKIDAGGKFDFYSMNEEYFKRARIMVEMASKKGFIPVLVVLWCDYVKNTWASNSNPMNIMPMDVVKSYTEYIVKLFSPYNPIYLISGDTDFGSEQTTLTYMTAMKTIKSLCPDALTTLHIGAGITGIPEDFIKSVDYCFYMYQSSHYIESQDFAYKLAEDFCRKPVKRPIINGEPCYEGCKFIGTDGRFNEFHVRKAIWQSLLSGAGAGVTYGAHGIWNWHREGKKCLGESIAGKSFTWRTALRFKGAWDAAFAKYIFETYDLFRLEPKDTILNETKEIRMSVSKNSDRIAIYAPYNTDVSVDMDLNGYDWILINLKDKLFAKPVVKVENGLTIIKMHEFNSDALIIGMK